MGEDENVVRYPPLPAWFFAVQALAVAGVLLAQLLEPDDALKVTFAVAVIAVVLGSRYWLNRSGVGWVFPNARDTVPLVLVVLGVGVACWVVSAVTDVRWVWIVGAVAAAAAVLVTGRRSRQVFGHGG